MISYIIQDIKKVMIYLPVGAAVLVFAIIICCIGERLLGKIGEMTCCSRITHIVTQSLLVSYLFVMLCITFLSRENGSRIGLDLLPFSTMGQGVQNDAYVVENILLFIPLGMLTAASCPRLRQFWGCMKAGLMFSLLIEISQMLSKRGYVQTDDVLMNALGMACGYLIYRVINQILKKV